MTTEHDILTQLGYYDTELIFCSLRFTPDQFDTFQQACERRDGTPEEVVVSMCETDIQTQPTNIRQENER